MFDLASMDLKAILNQPKYNKKGLWNLLIWILLFATAIKLNELLSLSLEIYE